MIDFKPTLQYTIDRDPAKVTMRVIAPSQQSPVSAVVSGRTLSANVQMPGVAWTEEKRKTLETFLRNTLLEAIEAEAKNLIEGQPTFMPAARRINAILQAAASNHLNTVTFPAEAQARNVIADKADSELRLTESYLAPLPVSGVPEVPEEPDFPEGTTVTAYAQGISTQFRLANGTLFVGTGIPGDKYNITSNDLIELAIMSHRRSQWDQGRTLDGESVTLDLTNTTPPAAADRWNISWSVGLKTDLVAKITDLFQVQLVLNLNSAGSNDDAQALIFDLVEGPGTFSPYILKLRGAPEGTPAVVDSKGSPDNKCVQNSTSYHWFKTSLIPALANDATIPVEGIFVCELRAYNIQTGNVLVSRVRTTAMM